VNVSLSFPQTGGSFEYPDATGGLVSSYSTYGPTYDMYFKPAVAAREPSPHHPASARILTRAQRVVTSSRPGPSRSARTRS
jgi:hypothetical protein